MELMTPTIALIFYGGLGVSMLMVLYRLAKGPHVLDRVMCLDVLALLAICLFNVWQMQTNSAEYFDAVLIIVLVGFLSTVALTKYLDSGKVLE